ncbi:MAG: recombination protein RecR [Thermotogae bacterium]|nr:recombination protein RecR [Thermotogota bacterium]
MRLPRSFRRLVSVLDSLPEIGPVSAKRIGERLVFDREKREALIEALKGLDEIGLCRRCRVITDEEVCEVCRDTTRERRIMVVLSPFDVFKVEESGRYRGKYFVLYRLVDITAGVMPEDLPLKEFRRMVEEERPEEIIMALPNEVKADVTARYLLEALGDMRPKITKLPSGVPRGGDVSSLDPYTLAEALEHRIPFEEG